ncbi:DNA-binding protein [Pseudomonas asiatica]|uniref:DNA-binding protein n=1 Tax=Pseudomonas asiatica TaxID=2219225 RepID=UPI0016683325|nr:DNA-binding protein [Pseudomonas asiatica]QNT38789.1 DNA-binding protein [Pseudomonas asiatica]
MAVGVPENDVFAAADAVLARGERPTVERVRLELGRGSPARVGALLDQWWEQLAGRLRGETRLPGLPAEVAQAFVAIWQQATTLAQGVVEQSLSSQRQVLIEEREALGALEARARLDVAQARQQTADAVTARQGAEIRLADLEQLLTQRQAQIDDLRSQRDELQAQRDELRMQLTEVRQQLQGSREQAEQTRSEQQRYTRDVEDRAYREIDRAREESKGLSVQLKDANARVHALQQALQAEQHTRDAAHEQRVLAEAHSTVLNQSLVQLRQVAAQAEERCNIQQIDLQQLQTTLVEAQRKEVMQQARADTLELQLGQLRDALQKSPPRRRTNAITKS